MQLRILSLVFLLCLFAAGSRAQDSRNPLPVNNDFVQSQFGSTCDLTPNSVGLTGDLDGDGVEDIVISAHCGNPLMDQTEHNYQVVDPFNSFYGYGDVKITSGFASENPESRGMALLVIHGAGAEAWRSPSPKAKFLMINLPFKAIALRKLEVKKKTVSAIFAEESSGSQTVSAVYWDGKKYKYRPIGSSLE